MRMTVNGRYQISSDSGNGKPADIVLVSFNGDEILSDDAEKEMRERRLRPAHDDELNSFNDNHPDTCTDRLIVGLGTVAKFPTGHHVVPCLSTGSQPRLYAEFRKRAWPAGTCFAAVPLDD